MNSVSISNREQGCKAKKRMLRSKKGAFAHFADLMIGVVFMILVAYLVFTFVGAKRTAEQGVIQTASNEADASRDFLVLLRTPMEDGRMVAEHIVDAYLNDSLSDPKIQEPLTKEIYRYFNTYYKASDIFWNLQVSEELYDGDTRYYCTFNRVRSIGSGQEGGKDPCMFNVKTMSTVRLPVQKGDVKNLLIEQRECFTIG